MKCELCHLKEDLYSPGLCERHATIGRVVLGLLGPWHIQMEFVTLGVVNTMLRRFEICATQHEFDYFYRAAQPSLAGDGETARA